MYGCSLYKSFDFFVCLKIYKVLKKIPYINTWLREFKLRKNVLGELTD